MLCRVSTLQWASSSSLARHIHLHLQRNSSLWLLLPRQTLCLQPLLVPLHLQTLRLQHPPPLTAVAGGAGAPNDYDYTDDGTTTTQEPGFSGGGRSSAPAADGSSPNTIGGIGVRAASQAPGDKGSGSNVGLIAGLTVAIVLAFAAVAALVVALVVHRRRQNKESPKHGFHGIAHSAQPAAYQPAMPPAAAGLSTVPAQPPQAANSTFTAHSSASGGTVASGAVPPSHNVTILQATRSSLGVASAEGGTDTIGNGTAPAFQKNGTLLCTETQSAMQQLQQRVVPKGTGASAASGGAPFTTEMPATLMEPDLRGKVSTALYNMAEQEPPVLLAGRFQLLGDQCHGGQAVVQFARDALRGSLTQYAVKCALHIGKPGLIARLLNASSTKLDSLYVQM